MRRDEAIRLLTAHQPALERFGVRALVLFGSVARNEATAASDVDVLVDFGGSATFAQYMDHKLYLEDLLGTKVDLVTERGLKARVRPHVERDAIRVA
jgi:predicted nucleotidyltransferase